MTNMRATLHRLLRSTLAAPAILFLFATSPASHAQSLQPGGPTDFGSQPVGVSSTITLSFSASVTTTISSVVATTDGVTGQDFTVSKQNCTGTLFPPESCSITIAFKPTGLGLRRGYLAVSDGTGTVVNHVYLHGVGTGAQLVYTPSSYTLLGTAPSISPSSLGVASAAYDPAGDVFFTDVANGRVLEQLASGTIAILASLPVTTASTLALDGSGTLYISSPTQGLVYSLVPGKTPTILATGTTKLVSPTGLATDGVGYLYIADSVTGQIVRVALDTFATTPLTLVGLATPLSSPAGLAVDANNNLYIADAGNDRIVKLGLYTAAATVAPITGLTLNNPTGLTIDSAGTFTIADTGNDRLVVAPPSLPAYALVTPNLTFVSPTAVLARPNGDLLVADSGLGLLAIARSSLAINFPTSTKVGTLDTVDGVNGVISFTLQNTGNYALSFPKATSGFNPSVTSKAFIDTANGHTCPILSAASPITAADNLALGASCTYTVEFSPTNTGQNNANLVITAVDLAGSGVSISPSIALSGIGYSSIASFSIVATPTLVGLGNPVAFTLTALNNLGQPVTDYLGTVSLGSTDPTATFSSGNSYTFTAADAGVHTFVAAGGVYFHQVGTFTLNASDNNYIGTSNPVQVFNQPAVTLASSVNPIFVGNLTTLTSTVSFTGGSPTGTVTFFATPSTGGTLVALGTATLASGVATITASFSTVDTPTLTAVYSGDANYAPNTSPALVETVQDFTLVNSTLGTPSATPGQPANLTFLITPIGGTTLPSNITFSLAGLPTGATYTVSPTTLAAGAGASTVTFTITAPPIGGAHRTTAGITSRTGALALALFALPLALLRRRKFAPLALIVLLGVMATGLTGCMGTTNGGYFEETPANFTVTVTATSGALNHTTTAPVSITVQ